MNKLLNRLTPVLLATSAVLFAAETAGAQVRFSDNLLKKDDAWFRSDEAKAIADCVIQYQSPQGGWPKSTNLATPPKSPDDIPPPGQGRANSFDNDATTVPMRFLARITHATGEAKYKESFLRGLHCMLAAQYPHGGWPQFWPLRKGYYSQITYNDGAMIRVMEVVRDVAKGDAPNDFVDAERRAKADRALSLGLDCILKTQIRQDGKPTAWCAQHDAKTLEPTWARAYEPPSLSGGESVGIIRFLMEIEEPSDEIVASIEGAVEWVRSVEMNGWRQERVKNDDARRERTLVADPEADSLWARFYELKTNRPLYLDRDSKFRYDYSEISYERRSGYSYHGSWGASLLEKDYPRWREKHAVKVARVSAPAPDGARHRVVVSTDIGGTDPDDFQSMVHLLVYADVLDIEGLVSSPYGDGRTRAILDVIDCYEKDFTNLKTYSEQYPAPDALRAITKQGETDRAPYAGIREATEGSRWIVECARRDDPRPLNVLVWGGIEDVAQALHDAPDILPKLCVYWIGGPNKKWAPDAYQYVVDNHPELWMIESNAAYRGWFTGGNQSGEWENQQFVAKHVKGRGALGDFFVEQKADVKMGDTPSVGRLLKGTPDDPTKPSWGGSYVPAWKRPYLQLDRMPVKADRIEAFGILELVLPATKALENPEAFLKVENQKLVGHFEGDETVRFRFCPKAAKRYNFEIASNVPSLNGNNGTITAYIPSPDVAKAPSEKLPNWWTDDLSSGNAEGPHSGAKTVSRWREEFLGDFAKRMLRCSEPAATHTRTRVIVTSDGEIDDECSMVRFLLYANEWDIEAIVTSSSQYHWQGHKWAGDDWILPYLDAYEQVYPNLIKHDTKYPTPEYLKSRIALGNVKSEGDMEAETDGSRLIVKILLDESDERPIWLQAWGGPNTIARALKTIEDDHPEQMATVAKKLRFFFIWEQDDTYQKYIRPSWGKYNIPTIISDQFVAFAYHWEKILPKQTHSVLRGNWMNRNILQNHGPLCSLYKSHDDGRFRSEGDSPAFTHTIPTGLRSTESPDWGGWGGRYVRVRENTWLDPVQEVGYEYPAGRWYTANAWGRSRMRKGKDNDQELAEYLKPMWRWFDAMQSDFASRADWCVKPYNQANHPPQVKLSHGVNLQVRPGERVSLNATGTSDPDGDALSYQWRQYEEADSAQSKVVIDTANAQQASFVVPSESGKQVHILLEVTDNGTPTLRRYQRVICDIE